jgi:DNA-binding response OmpR family regulator
VTPFKNGKEFLDALADWTFDLIFLDILMPVLDGFQVMEALKNRSVKIPIIVLSSLSQRENVVKALGFGVRSYMAKPLKPEEIRKKAVEILKTDF